MLLSDDTREGVAAVMQKRRQRFPASERPLFPDHPGQNRQSPFQLFRRGVAESGGRCVRRTWAGFRNVQCLIPSHSSWRGICKCQPCS